MFCQQVRANAPAGVSLEPSGDSGRIVWGVSLAGECVCFSRVRVGGLFWDRARWSSWILELVHAVGLGESESWILASVQPTQPR